MNKALQHIQILMIDDDEDDILLMDDMLEGLKSSEQYFTLHAFTSLKKATESLKTHQTYQNLKDHYIQLALLDLNLGPTQGIETLRAFKRKIGNLPVIVLTGMAGEKIGRSCIREGASDYLVKDRFSPEQFVRSINYAIERYSLAEEVNFQKTKIEQSYAQLEELLFAVSHDLKEPLQGIVRFTQLLQRKHENQLDEGDKDALKFIAGEGKRQYAQIDGLMQYLEINQKKKHIETVYLNNLVSKINDQLREKYKLETWSINYPPLPNILFNKELASILFEQLLDNTIKFKKESQTNPKTNIELEDNDTYWTFHVIDQGIGIPLEMQPKIWGLFKQGLFKHDQKGIGLGLALVQKIVHSFGGQIDIDSQIGKKTTITFSIPKNIDKRTLQVLKSRY